MTESTNNEVSSEEIGDENQESVAASDSSESSDLQDSVFAEVIPPEGVDENSRLKIEMENLNKELVATQDKYLRSLADFENFKKRAQKERSDLLKYQGEQIVIDLIRVVDDLDLAIQFNEVKPSNEESVSVQPDKFREGVELIYKSFCEILKKWDIRPESAIGKTFDPVKHLAISRVYIEGTAPGTVISELKKVFFYKDKLIRVGEVVVASEQNT